MVHPVTVVTKVDFFLSRIQCRRPCVGLGEDHGVGVGARRQPAYARPIVVVSRQAERRLFGRDALHRKFEGAAHPWCSRDRARRRHAVVLVIGHEGEEVGGLRQRGEIVGARPLMEVVEERPAGCLIAGEPGNHGDRQVETRRMKSVGAILRQGRQEVAVGPGDLLEVQLKPRVAVGLRLLDQVGGEGGAPGRVREDRMGNVRIDILVDDQRNDGNATGVGRVDHVAPRVARDGAVGIGVVPRRTQHIDLVQVREERRAAIIGVDVIHLDHPAGQYPGQRRRDGEFCARALAAPRPVCGLDPRINRDAGLV